MDESIPLIWYLAISMAFGLLLGYAIGMAIGVATGKQQLTKKIRMLISRERLDFDIDRLLRSARSKFIKEDLL